MAGWVRRLFKDNNVIDIKFWYPERNIVTCKGYRLITLPEPVVV